MPEAVKELEDAFMVNYRRLAEGKLLLASI